MSRDLQVEEVVSHDQVIVHGSLGTEDGRSAVVAREPVLSTESRKTNISDLCKKQTSVEKKMVITPAQRQDVRKINHSEMKHLTGRMVLCSSAFSLTLT